MAKQAHITSAPDLEVGTRTLALCGKDFKVKVQWGDVPRSKRICRDCVDMAVVALSETDSVLGRSRFYAEMALRRVTSLAEVLSADLMVDEIAKTRLDYEVERERAEREKRTCICTWTSPEVFVEHPHCPIHGEGLAFAEITETETDESPGEKSNEEPPVAPSSDEVRIVDPSQKPPEL